MEVRTKAPLSKAPNTIPKSKAREGTPTLYRKRGGLTLITAKAVQKRRRKGRGGEQKKEREEPREPEEKERPHSMGGKVTRRRRPKSR